MHYSRQRACILEAVQHSGDHPTAEAVYRLVKPVLPAIGPRHRIPQPAHAGRGGADPPVTGAGRR